MPAQEIGPVIIYSVNINSIIAHEGSRFEKLKDRISNLSKRPHAILLQETKLNAEIKDEKLAIKGYRLIRRDREVNGRYGGGVAIYAREDCRLLSVFKDNVIEAITAILTIDGAEFAITSTYKPPSTKMGTYIISLINFLSKNYSQYNIVGGDFNLDLNCIKAVDKFKRDILLTSSMFMMGMKPTVYNPTHKGHIIDQVYIPMKAIVVGVQLEEPIEAEHRPIYLEFKIKEDEEATDKFYKLRIGMKIYSGCIGIALINKWINELKEKKNVRECVQYVKQSFQVLLSCLEKQIKLEYFDEDLKFKAISSLEVYKDHFCNTVLDTILSNENVEDIDVKKLEDEIAWIAPIIHLNNDENFIYLYVCFGGFFQSFQGGELLNVLKNELQQKDYHRMRNILDKNHDKETAQPYYLSSEEESEEEPTPHRSRDTAYKRGDRSYRERSFEYKPYEGSTESNVLKVAASSSKFVGSAFKGAKPLAGGAKAAGYVKVGGIATAAVAATIDAVNLGSAIKEDLKNDGEFPKETVKTATKIGCEWGGAICGAKAGVAVGAIGGPVGAAAGAVVGSIVGSIFGGFFGKGLTN